MMVEWDEHKRIANLEEHQVDFMDAALVFEDTVIAAEDDGKRRYQAILAEGTSEEA